jgi:hypothetical protein
MMRSGAAGGSRFSTRAIACSGDGGGRRSPPARGQALPPVCVRIAAPALTFNLTEMTDDRI